MILKWIDLNESFEHINNAQTWKFWKVNQGLHNFDYNFKSNAENYIIIHMEVERHLK